MTTSDAAADGDKRGEQLDELNKATFAKYTRAILDRGVSVRDPESALYRGPTSDPDSPLCKGLLEVLRENAESVYADARQAAKGRR